ncbi:MAG: EAL domain-containing protein [Candidatus Competibacteraceae bacterium]|nr:EAL domain-containing protein [Candidatus Competibacteraceae bacterium]
MNAITVKSASALTSQLPVLVVDDDRDFADSTTDLLEISGYHAIPAYSATEALQIASREQVEVALIDVKLGATSGVELVGQLRRIREHMLCVMVTGYASMETAVQALKQGAYDYLYKPFNTEDLLISLQRLFEHLEIQHEKERFEQTLQQREQQFRDLIEGAPQGILIHRNSKPLYVNQAYVYLLGFTSPAEVLAQASIDSHFPDHEHKRLLSYDTACLQHKQQPLQYEVDALHRNGQTLTLQNMVRVIDWAGQPAIQYSVIDITQRKRALQALRLYEKIVSSTSDLMAFVDRHYCYQAVNDAYLAAYGKDRAALVGHSLRTVHGTALFNRFLRASVDQCLTGKNSKYQDWVSFPEKGRCYMDVAFYPYHDEEIGSISGVVISWRDLTETYLLSEKLSYQASHDALTGLYNRFAFERRLHELLDSAQQRSDNHVLCYLDLDQFKIINDSCGHTAGDELLRQLGVLLRDALSEKDLLARLGGDEFGLLLQECSIEQAQRIAGRLLEIISQYQFVWENKAFSIGASIGMVPISSNSESVGSILRIADSACYVAKEEGGNRVHLYYPNDSQLAQRRSEMRWVTVLKEALQEESRLLLMQQPIISLAQPDGEICYELLLRMRQQDSDQLILPGAFLAAAERYNLSIRLDHWVVTHALHWLAAHPEHVKTLSLCTINLSGLSLSDNTFLSYLRDTLKTSGIAPHKLCFEITETAAIANLGTAKRFIRALRDQGCHFALDDFGSGFCSLNYLKNLPVDFLKIDGMFIKNIDTDPIDTTMVQSINDIAHKMGKRTIAEFVENDRTLHIIKDIGIDYAQGYVFGRPTPLSQLLDKKP